MNVTPLHVPAGQFSPDADKHHVRRVGGTSCAATWALAWVFLRALEVPGGNPAHTDTTIMTVCPILILSPFFSR
jgi:hypothetical protein